MDYLLYEELPVIVNKLKQIISIDLNLEIYWIHKQLHYLPAPNFSFNPTTVEYLL